MFGFGSHRVFYDFCRARKKALSAIIDTLWLCFKSQQKQFSHSCDSFAVKIRSELQCSWFCFALLFTSLHFFVQRTCKQHYSLATIITLLASALKHFVFLPIDSKRSDTKVAFKNDGKINKRVLVSFGSKAPRQTTYHFLVFLFYCWILIFIFESFLCTSDRTIPRKKKLKKNRNFRSDFLCWSIRNLNESKFNYVCSSNLWQQRWRVSNITHHFKLFFFFRARVKHT